MASIDYKFYAHVGVEIVVIGGISFYMYKKINSLQAQIDELKKQNQELAQILANQNVYLNNLIAPNAGIKSSGGSSKKVRSAPEERVHPEGAAPIGVQEESQSSQVPPQKHAKASQPSRNPSRNPSKKIREETQNPSEPKRDKRDKRKKRSDSERRSPPKPAVPIKPKEAEEPLEEIPPDDDEDARSGFNTEDLDHELERELGEGAEGERCSEEMCPIEEQDE